MIFDVRSSDFNLDRLDELFSLGKHHGGVFWRHDVDFSVDAALKMSLFEAERGISATYYLIYDENWPFYSYREAIEAEYLLFSSGHRVGWHIDERRFQDFDVTARGLVSFHCPTERVLWRDFPGMVSAYSRIWKDRYCADSGGRFRFGAPESTLFADIVNDRPNQRQINLHPEWWFQPDWLDNVTDEEHERYWYSPKPAKTRAGG